MLVVFKFSSGFSSSCKTNFFMSGALLFTWSESDKELIEVWVFLSCFDFVVSVSDSEL